MMASSPPQAQPTFPLAPPPPPPLERGGEERGPPPGMAFELDEWVPCQAYLGCMERGEMEAGSEEELTRVIARLHRRHEGDHGGSAPQGNTEVYVKVNVMGFVLRVITPTRPGQESDGPREGIREFFELVRVARCTANHQPRPRTLLWVYNRQPMLPSIQPLAAPQPGEARVECHAVVCRDLKDATRLANTLASVFQEARRRRQRHHLPPLRAAPVRGAAASPLGGGGDAIAMSSLMMSHGERPPAYTPEARGSSWAGARNSSEPPDARGRRVLEVVAAHQQAAPAGEDEDADDDLDSTDLPSSPRSLGSASPRPVTPRQGTWSALSSSSSPQSSPSRSARPAQAQTQAQAASSRNSTVSLHSAVAMSEWKTPSTAGRPRSGRPRSGRRSTGMPDVSGAGAWQSFE